MLAFFIGGFMDLILCRTYDAENVMGKKFDSETTLDIYLKRDIDISNPTLILKSEDCFNGINYAKIPMLKRFYFVDSIQNIGVNLWQLELSCDVLETYRGDILASKARFYRKIKNGDCVNATLDTCSLKTVSRFDSNKGFDSGTTTILTAVGGA